MSTDLQEAGLSPFTSSDSTPQLAAALAKFQGQVGIIHKDKTAKIDPRDATKKGFVYKYADLASIAEAAYSLLAQNGLSFTAMPTMTERGFVLDYALMHESGEIRHGSWPLPDPRQVDIKQIGIAITYARRYCFSAATGIVTEEDTDTRGAPAPQRIERAVPQRDFPGPTRVANPEDYDRKRKRMFALFNEMGMTDKDDQLAFIGSVLERDMTTRRDMTIEDYDKVIPELVAEQRTQQQPEPDGPLVPQGVNPETGEVADPWGANKT